MTFVKRSRRQWSWLRCAASSVELNPAQQISVVVAAIGAPHLLGMAIQRLHSARSSGLAWTHAGLDLRRLGRLGPSKPSDRVSEPGDQRLP
jgi:hypothetical protein